MVPESKWHGRLARSRKGQARRPAHGGSLIFAARLVVLHAHRFALSVPPVTRSERATRE